MNFESRHKLKLCPDLVSDSLRLTSEGRTDLNCLKKCFILVPDSFGLITEGTLWLSRHKKFLGLISNSFRLNWEWSHGIRRIEEVLRIGPGLIQIHSDWIPSRCIDSNGLKSRLEFVSDSFRLTSQWRKNWNGL